jgi:hypothetical protein
MSFIKSLTIFSRNITDFIDLNMHVLGCLDLRDISPGRTVSRETMSVLMQKQNNNQHTSANAGKLFSKFILMFYWIYRCFSCQSKLLIISQFEAHQESKNIFFLCISNFFFFRCHGIIFLLRRNRFRLRCGRGKFWKILLILRLIAAQTTGLIWKFERKLMSFSEKSLRVTFMHNLEREHS